MSQVVLPESNTERETSMKRSTIMVLLVSLIFGLSSILSAQEKGKKEEAANSYVGVKQCSMCHKTKKQGEQFVIWGKSKHAEAYKTLTTAAADEIAKKKGFKTKAAETPECLECHTVGSKVDAKLLGKTFDMKDGVQCEACHGAGSAFKNMAVMKDKKKAIAAGLTDFKDQATIEAKCKTCHNENSPTTKKFEFAKMWAQIEHKIPKE